eukprot:UN02503
MSSWDCYSCGLRNNCTRKTCQACFARGSFQDINAQSPKQNYINDYQNWTSTQVIDWIVTAENGKFKQYQSALTYSFVEEDIDGTCLDDIDQTDIKTWGIKEQDQKGILGIIHTLI